MPAFLTADRKIRTLLSLVAVFALVLGLCPIVVAGEDEEEEQAANLGQALKKGTFSLNLRYRYETVDDNAFEKDAHASTLRTAFGYRTLPWHGVSAFIEAENVTVVGNDLYNNKGAGRHWNGVDDRPVVADPAITEINRAYLNLAVIPDTELRAGRDEILLDNQRFVGNVGWRQNHQSFDAVALTNESIPHTTLTYIYMGNVNRIFGDNKQMGSHFVNAKISGCPYADFTLYYYMLDYSDEADWGASTGTFGGRLDGTWAADENWKIIYDLEYATQGDAADNPNDIDADYLRLEGGFGYGKKFTFTLGHEVLGGSPEDGSFSTPLATLHKWNGWADRFLATPEYGLEDTWAAAGGTFGDFTVKGIYHWFSSDTEDFDYGTEFDALVSWKSPWKQVFALKAALFDGGDFDNDVNKVFLYTQWGF